jgi:dihydropteroate synthase|tara:strand:+ start:120 stop:1016 length:897 start_codon:yes stop_codon:yes gene_type:complete
MSVLTSGPGPAAQIPERSGGRVMGVLNVTPDSFSDGGCFLDPVVAIAHGRHMIAEGAVILDVGGESTRPGAEPVGVEEELSRVVPVLEGLAGLPEVRDGSVRISIDTRHAEVARHAVAAGAGVINDVSSTLDGVAAELGVGWVAMHMQGDPRTMQQQPSYDDVVAEVCDFLVRRAVRAVDLGVAEVWIDPGIGFGKTTAHNMEIIGRLDELVATGWPVVLGVSRKRFLGDLTARSDTGAAAGPAGGHLEPTAPDDRREASVALATWAFHLGVSLVRAHDVRSTFQAARVVGTPGSRAR